MSVTMGLFADGRWSPGVGTAQVRNPYTGAVVGTVTRASPQQARDAVRALAAAGRGDLTAHDRATILAATADLLYRERDDVAVLISQESGLAVRDGHREVTRAVTQLRFCAQEALRVHGEAIRTDVTEARARRLAITTREPVGVVCAVTPFNRPLNQVVTKVAPALAAGNRVVVKPSEKTPLSAIRLLDTLLRAGLPPDQAALVCGEPAEIVDALLASGHVDMLTFTGSSRVGRLLAASAGMIRQTYELGDSGALVVMADADVPAAVAAAAAGAFATSGQSCRGVKRVIAHADVADEVAERLAEAASALVVGDPADPATDVGTLIDAAAADVVERRVIDAVAAGARVLCGARRHGAQYWPTVLDHVPPDTDLVRLETFGPTAPVVRVRDFAEAVAVVNGTRYGLQAGIFTRSLDLARRAGELFDVGAVVVNGGPQFESPNIPFGGVKDSGLGREGARYAIEEMTRLRTLIL
ncbi:putative aldehyde dehydrogenase [Frankia canadensis]|uniref:Putative aldehyde dehydrogenase n=1 Tax=Frankia canadensis TaxID=1836972 RepID=A0A2I2L134_9ACTN|nr:aldehyde dehydrogenase family protein [Frankia canadensis]SNQ51631.1 putative aldehyde dehydrogenase [Frankia canadensis]SOU58921.1 putative aldehyde dehydrogenase [Frankia canadensis]